MLAIRQFAGFSEVDLAELATIAENVIERSLPGGLTLVNAGSRFAGIYMVVEGELASLENMWGARQVVGALEVIAGRPARETILVRAPTQALLLPAHGFNEILEDNYGVLSTARRELARAVLRRAVERKLRVPHVGPRSLGIVERVLALRALPPFKAASLQALSALAQSAQEVTYAPGASIRNAGELSSGLLVVLDGSSSHTMIGGLETLADEAHAEDVTAFTAIRALHVPSAAVFDVMEDHTDFALSIVRTLASELLDHASLAPEMN